MIKSVISDLAYCSIVEAILMHQTVESLSLVCKLCTLNCWWQFIFLDPCMLISDIACLSIAFLTHRRSLWLKLQICRQTNFVITV